MLYYAYGSNLSTKYVRDYCPSAKFVMRAILPNYHIEFRRYSENLKGGISTILEAPGEFVHGVVYEVKDEEIKKLDVLEKVPLGIYTRDKFAVLAEDGKWVKADLYRIVVPEGPFQPAKKYIGYMLEGMREHGIDKEYMKKYEKLYKELPEDK